MRMSSRAGGMRLGPPEGGNERVRSSFGMPGSIQHLRARTDARLPGASRLRHSRREASFPMECTASVSPDGETQQLLSGDLAPGVRARLGETTTMTLRRWMTFA